MTQLDANTSITRGGKAWLVPSISATVWNINDVLATGLISNYIDDLYAMTVERCVNTVACECYGSRMSQATLTTIVLLCMTLARLSTLIA